MRMDWIDRLAEDAWNVVIDELVWHLREQRFPVSIHRRLSPVPGVEFGFKESKAAFLPFARQGLDEPALEEHWRQAVQIIAGVPELRAVEVRVSTAGDE